MRARGRGLVGLEGGRSDRSLSPSIVSANNKGKGGGDVPGRTEE